MYRVHVFESWDTETGRGPLGRGGPHLCCFTAIQEMIAHRDRVQDQGVRAYLVVLDEKGERVAGPVMALPLGVARETGRFS